MFYSDVLLSKKTGRRYVGSCENLAERIRCHNAGYSKTTWGYRGCYSEVKALERIPVQRNASDITRPGGVGTNWKNYRRAVAAATRERVKSLSSDVASCIGKLG
jgi:hypothetical protein